MVAANRSRSSSLKPRRGENISDREPCDTEPVVTPMRSSSSRTTILPPKTPMDPVRVDGSADMLVVGRSAQGCRDRVAADLAPHRAATRTPGRDHAAHLDEGDVAPSARRYMRTTPRTPPIGEQELSVGANPRAHRRVHLVAISKRVNQTGLERLGGSPRPGVGKLAHSHFLDRSASGDRGDRFGEDGLGKAVERDAVGLGELGAHEAVGGVLELVTLLELRLDAQAV